MLLRSVDDSQINSVFPNTFEEYKKWDKEIDELPPEEVYKALFEELAYGNKIQVGRALTRMNYSKSGWKSLIKKTSRAIKKVVKKEEFPESYKEFLIETMKNGLTQLIGMQWVKWLIIEHQFIIGMLLIELLIKN
tara:strand:- start:121 stop:525 length:405 start_codon:yes stop_codon:yes gene_type:complete